MQLLYLQILLLIISLISCEDDIFYGKTLQNLISILPQVYILSIDSKFNNDCLKCYDNIFKQHSNDFLFHRWLKNSNYNSDKINKTDKVLYFIPAYSSFW